MKRCVALACIMLAVASTAYAQQAGPGFTISIPNGWTSVASDDRTTEWRAPDGGSFCRANSIDMPSLAKDTQGQLNEDYADVWDAATWGDVLTVPAEKIQVSAGVSAQVDGHLQQIATISFAEDMFGGTRMTGRFASHVLVGRMVNAACFAPSDAFDGVKDLFEKTVSSLRAG